MKNGIQPAKILSLTSRKDDSNSKQKYDKLETCKQNGNSTTREMMVYPAICQMAGRGNLF
jgi:predicted Zn-ribbon and HTH transcriptional regulator